MATRMFSVLHGTIPHFGTGKLRRKFFKQETDARKWAADSLLDGTINYANVTKPEREENPSRHPYRTPSRKKMRDGLIVIHPLRGTG